MKCVLKCCGLEAMRYRLTFFNSNLAVVKNTSVSHLDSQKRASHRPN